MEIRPIASSLVPGTKGIERELPAPAAGASPVADTEAARKHPDGPPPAEAEVQQAVERINRSLPASNQGIEFAVDADTDRVIVKVVDRETREVLRQMPSEEALEIAKALERTQGMLIKLEV